MSQEFMNRKNYVIGYALLQTLLFFILTPGSIYTIHNDTSCDTSWFNIFKGKGACVTNIQALFVHSLLFFIISALLLNLTFSKISKNNLIIVFLLYTFTMAVIFFLLSPGILLTSPKSSETTNKSQVVLQCNFSESDSSNSALQGTCTEVTTEPLQSNNCGLFTQLLQGKQSCATNITSIAISALIFFVIIFVAIGIYMLNRIYTPPEYFSSEFIREKSDNLLKYGSFQSP